jgi:hypothetical protein
MIHATWWVPGGATGTYTGPSLTHDESCSEVVIGAFNQMTLLIGRGLGQDYPPRHVDVPWFT